MPADSALLAAPFKIKTVDYTEPVKAASPELNAPTVLGITIDNALSVIYSPMSLGNGWEQIEFPYNMGYADSDALRLGVNILSYAVTH